MNLTRLISLALLASSGLLAVAQSREIGTLQKPCRQLPRCFTAASTNVSIGDAAAPERAVVELKMGFKDELKKRPATAEKHFRKAVEIHPQFDSAIAALAESLSQQGNWEEAEHLTFGALQRAPNHPSLLRVEASISQHEKRYAESVPMLERSLSLEPHSEAALVLLARAEFMTGDCDRALRHSQQAHLEFPHTNAIAHLISAVCQERLHQFANARHEYELFLHEEQDGQGPEIVRKRLKALERAETNSN